MHIQLPLMGRQNILGVILDQCINMYEHVKSICRTAYYHLKNIHSLKALLTREALVTVVHAFVKYRIEYCNSPLYGISDCEINQLQRIQNSAARMVTNTRKYDHITPILQKHIGCLLDSVSILRCYHNMTNEYLCELVSNRKSLRKLGSSSQI